MMNWLNHFLFSFFLLSFFQPNFLLNLLFSSVSLLLDLDHLFKGRRWYEKRRWTQEPFGIFLFSLIIFISSLKFPSLIFLIIPLVSHLFLDYLCIYKAFPLAPFSKLEKREGMGIFIPDDFFKSKGAELWRKRVKVKGLKGISENYFTVLLIILICAQNLLF